MPATVSPCRWSDVRAQQSPAHAAAFSARRTLKTLLLCLAVTALSQSAAADVELDAESGLAIATGWQLVKAHCGACHSTKLVTAQRGGRDYWLDTIRWMQRTQNLWDLPPAIEEQVLDYLADNYSEEEWGRRPPLSPILLPAQR